MESASAEKKLGAKRLEQGPKAAKQQRIDNSEAGISKGATYRSRTHQANEVIVERLGWGRHLVLLGCNHSVSS